MPIETFGFPDSLNASYPPTSDGLVGGDDHIRGIKATIKNTFPNLTGAVTGTQAQLNGLVTWYTSGITLFADTGAFFYTVPGTGPTGFTATPSYLEVDVAGYAAARFYSSGRLYVAGSLDAGGPITGPGACPIGTMVMWPSDTLPSDYGTWAWANGQAISRTTYAACYAVMGTSHGAGDGVTTFNLINMQEVVPVGKSTMGGATAPGLLTSIAVGVKNVLGSFFGADTVTLTISQMPVHYHAAGIYDPGHTHTYHDYTIGAQAGNQAGWFGINTEPTSATSSSTTGVRINSSNGLDQTYSAGGGTAHSNVQPSRVVNFIIRIA